MVALMRSCGLVMPDTKEIRIASGNLLIDYKLCDKATSGCSLTCQMWLRPPPDRPRGVEMLGVTLGMTRLADDR